MIEKNEAGQRLDKFLAKYMNEASKSFFYKMMRKKNITLNGKKCEGNEKLAEGDVVKLFLAEDTIEKFSSVQVQEVKKVDLDILYEDDEIILVNKPAGMLSQKAKETDESLVEYLIDYLLGSSRRAGSARSALRSATVWTGIPAVSWLQENLWRGFRCFPACLKTARSISIISVLYPARSGT